MVFNFSLGSRFEKWTERNKEPASRSLKRVKRYEQDGLYCCPTNGNQENILVL